MDIGVVDVNASPILARVAAGRGQRSLESRCGGSRAGAGHVVVAGAA
jgi:hypothetical protein